MKLEFPNQTHEQQYNNIVDDFWERTSPWRLFDWEDFHDFLKMINNDVEKNCMWVNSHLFFAIVNWDIVWAIQIRHHIEHPGLKEVWGHIWYWIWPSFRKKWYATQMLKLSLLKAKKLWLEKVLLTCDDDNIGSYKTIEKNGWVFERLSTDWLMRRYWVSI